MSGSLSVKTECLNLERLGKHLKLFTDKHEHSGEAVILQHSIPRPQRP